MTIIRLLRLAIHWSLTPLMITASMAVHAQEDPYQWLEEVSGEKALAWVKQQNAVTQPAIESSPGFKPLHERLLGIYNSRDRIPSVKKREIGRASCRE